MRRAQASTWGQPDTRVAAPRRAATGPAQAAIGWLPGTPEPSRLPVASGRSTGAPLAAAARAGAVPAQAKTRVSSPLRKRWQRTPPVARPLGGYSEKGATLTAPGSVPGSAVDEPDAVTTTEAAGSTAPNHDGRLTGGDPDPGDAAAGPALRAHGVGAEVQELGVGGDEAERLVAGGQVEGADDLVVVLEAR